jgi:hypothetical protein
VSDDSVATCGARCTPCPSVSRGDAGCISGQCVATCTFGDPCHGACPSSAGATCWTETTVANNARIRAKLALQGTAVSWTEDAGADDALWFAQVGTQPMAATQAGLCNGHPDSPIAIPRGSIGTAIYCESAASASPHAIMSFTTPSNWSENVTALLPDGGGIRSLDDDINLAWFFLDDATPAHNRAVFYDGTTVEDFGSGAPRYVSVNYEGAALPQKIAYSFVTDAGVPVLRWKSIYMRTALMTVDVPRAADITQVRTNAGPEYLTGVGATDAGLIFRREPDQWRAEPFGGPSSVGATFDLLTKFDDSNYVAWSNDAGVWLSTRTGAGLWFTERVSASPADQVRVSSFGGTVAALKAGQRVWICR